MKVAIVQFAPLPPALSPSPSPDDAGQQPLPSEYNLRRAHDFARQAAAQGADLVCFPEYFLSGEPPHLQFRRRLLAQSPAAIEAIVLLVLSDFTLHALELPCPRRTRS